LEQQMSFFRISEDASGWDDEVLVLVARGEIDFAASPQLRERIAEDMSAGRRRLVLDLSRVTFLDSTAIGVLVGAAMRLREHGGGSLAVVCGEENRHVLRTFDMAGVTSMVALYHSHEEARSALAVAVGVRRSSEQAVTGRD
jgi:anti-sigma B factor antagonist